MSKRSTKFDGDAQGGPLWFRALDLLCLGLARVLIGIMMRLPEVAGRKMAKGCISVLKVLMPRIHVVGLRNLEIVFPEKSLAEREDILERSYKVLANNLYAYSKLPQLDGPKAVRTISYEKGSPLINGIRAREKNGMGVIIATVHYGGFENLVQCHAYIDRPCAILARGFGLPKLDDWWNARREMFGNQVFTRKGGYPEIIRRVKKGQDVAILFDQNVKSSHAVFVDLFGLKAATTKAIGLAALRTGAPVVFCAAADNFDGTLTLLAEEIPNPIHEDGTVEEKVERLTERLHQQIERVVRLHPEQWFWIHRRFKTRPPGQTETVYSVPEWQSSKESTWQQRTTSTDDETSAPLERKRPPR